MPYPKGECVNKSEYVDVELDQEDVVFQGSEDEAIGVYLGGRLAFRFKEPTAITHIRLHLSGVRRVSAPTRAGWIRTSRESEFYKRTWEFHDASQTAPEILPVRHHKYPFSAVLEGTLPESIEGFRDASITYFFKVEIGRKHGKDVSYRKPLRIIRIPKLQAVDTTLEEVWANKIAYQVHIPSKAVAFGTAIDVNYGFVPLLKDLKIDRIETQLSELREFTLNEDDLVLARNSDSTRILSSDRYTIDEGAQDPTRPKGGCQFSHSIPLPQSLRQCVQDTDTMGIRVKHKLRIYVRMQNPDGHYSELRIAVPVSIYLSPSYRVWDGCFTGEAPPPALIASGDGEEAPPAYGQHEMDRIYEGRDEGAGTQLVT
ncbi:arrestin family protein [Aspergillus lucknowensis]|uniref:HECT-type ubiquitin ligase-interacting protein apyA n=1 Tax=Aspergillus lucknowensis TaxID=176173 RepID=A0ABR4LKY8_9EURO